MKSLQKRLAAKIGKTGMSKVRVNPIAGSEIKEAITKADVRSLIERKIITFAPVKSPSRYRAKLRQAQKKKGRQRGQGSRKGTKSARSPRKRAWINKIRALRALLVELREKQRIDQKTYRNMYVKSKSGLFRDRGHMMFYLKENNLLKGVK